MPGLVAIIAGSPKQDELHHPRMPGPARSGLSEPSSGLVHAALAQAGGGGEVRLDDGGDRLVGWKELQEFVRAGRY